MSNDPNQNDPTPASTVEDAEDSLEHADSAEVTRASEVQSVAPKQSFGKRVIGLIRHVNIYFLIFVLIVVLTAGIVYASYLKNKKLNAPTSVNTTTLSGDTLSQIQSSTATVGDPKQTLTIESNSIFSGKVLIRDSLDVAGALKVGGALSLPGISVSGAASFDQIQANGLGISGNVSVQGQLTVQKGITSTSGATFGGPISAPQLTVQSLQLSGDLQIVRHIDAGGSSPGKTDGGALGNGGTSSVSGTDTAGTATINTGGGTVAGCFITIDFVNKFNGTPHVIITPVGSAAGGLSYYVTRTTSNFTICSTNPAPAGQTFSFDFVVLD